MSSPSTVRIRRMSAGDVGLVVEIGASLREAPQWAVSVYLAALDPSHGPRRIALVAEWGLQTGEDSSEGPEEKTAGAKAHAYSQQVSARLKPCPDTRPSGGCGGSSFSAASETAPFQDGGFGPAVGRVVGFTVASVVAPEAELETIAVAAEGQRRGVGARLLRALVEELKAEQVTELLLEVRASNRAAIQFYRAQGFVETGRRARYYADPEEDAVLMGLRLG